MASICSESEPHRSCLAMYSDIASVVVNDTRQPMHQTCQRFRFGAGLASRLRTRPKEAKLAYVTLNTQTPCPPRGAVPVNQGRGFASLFHLSTPGSPSVMDATFPAMLYPVIAERLGHQLSALNRINGGLAIKSGTSG